MTTPDFSLAAPTVLAFDIGGANIKISDGAGVCASHRFSLWKNPARLATELEEATSNLPPVGRWVVTMTGELCDCFTTKREGVTAIIDAVVAAARGGEVQIYLVDGSFTSPEDAKRRYLETAASNWHALVTFAARRCAPNAGVLLDIGSTTTDVLPFVAGRSGVTGKTDPARLSTGEMVYSGVVRSPVCAITPTLPWRGRVCGTAQELFATTRDVYLTLGALPEDPVDCETADGRPATREGARDRLARMIAADREMFSGEDAQQAAVVVRQAQIRRIAESFVRVSQSMSDPPRTVVICGQGEFLAREVLRFAGWTSSIVSLGTEFGEAVSRVMPAYALARIATGNMPLPDSAMPSNLLAPTTASIGAGPIATGPMVAGPMVAGAAASTLAPISFNAPAPPPISWRKDLRVVKFGGSSLTMDTYVDRLREWFKRQPPGHSLILVGGGREVRQIASEQEQEHYSDIDAHWRCIDVMLANAKELQAAMPEAKWLADVEPLPPMPEASSLWVVDPRRFMELDSRRVKGRLPESWDVSSDSIAARLAEQTAAGELAMLKSRLPSDVRRLGKYVDPYFPAASRRLPRMRFVNLRDPNFAEALLERKV